MLKARLLKILGLGRWAGALGEEDRNRLDFVNYCRELTYNDTLRCVWFSVPNEFGGNKQRLYGAKLGVLGRVSGAPDLVFLWPNKSLCLEFKASKGKLSENQKIFQEWCQYNNVDYHVVYSCDQAKSILNQYLINT